MNAPLVGSWSVEVKDVKPFTIHGDLYYELQIVRIDDPSLQLLVIRTPQHTVTGVPKTGDKLAVSFLMGQVTSARTI